MNAVEVSAFQCACGKLFPATTSGRKACEKHCYCSRCLVNFCPETEPMCKPCHLDERIAQAVKERMT